MATVINRLIQKHGGAQGTVDQLQQQGLGVTVKSWVSTGANQSQPIRCTRPLASAIAEVAAKAGLNPQDLAQKLAHMLPQAIDKLTPNGLIPSA